MEDITEWLIDREDCIGYSNCKKCSKQFMCDKEECTGIVKFSQTKNNGKIRKEK